MWLKLEGKLPINFLVYEAFWEMKRTRFHVAINEFIHDIPQFTGLNDTLLTPLHFVQETDSLPQNNVFIKYSGVKKLENKGHM